MDDYAARVSVGDFVSLGVALTALAISGVSLWLTVLRPARLSLTYMTEHTEIGKGGVNEIPAMTEIRGFIALANLGAQAGLLQRVDFEIPSVQPETALRFAVGVQQREPTRDFPMVTLDGEALNWPKTIESGDVRTLEFNFGLAGAVRTERNTTRLHPADLRPLAELIAELESVHVPLVATYRTGRRLFGQRRATCSIRISGAELRRAALAYWQEAGRSDLAEIVGASFTGRDIDKM
ncbi:MAG: hypothetical protein ACTHKT_04815 [Solirubrobacterales bacterium]